MNHNIVSKSIKPLQNLTIRFKCYINLSKDVNIRYPDLFTLLLLHTIHVHRRLNQIGGKSTERKVVQNYHLIAIYTVHTKHQNERTTCDVGNAKTLVAKAAFTHCFPVLTKYILSFMFCLYHVKMYIVNVRPIV